MISAPKSVTLLEYVDTYALERPVGSKKSTEPQLPICDEVIHQDRSPISAE